MKPFARRLAWAALAGVALAPACRAEYGDIHFTRKEGIAQQGSPPATFPHSVHRIQFRCYVCHEDRFVMKGGANDITMDAITAGKFCGACHNGKTAFQVGFDTCQRCHRE